MGTPDMIKWRILQKDRSNSVPLARYIYILMILLCDIPFLTVMKVTVDSARQNSIFILPPRLPTTVVD